MDLQEPFIKHHQSITQNLSRSTEALPLMAHAGFLGFCLRQSKPGEVIYVYLKRENLELFILDAIEFNEDVNNKKTSLAVPHFTLKV